MGVLQQYVTENDWEEKTDKTALFAHNIQYQEVHKMDIYGIQSGRGVGGRMVDILKKEASLLAQCLSTESLKLLFQV